MLELTAPLGKFKLPDELEFLVRSTGVSGRNFSGDEEGGLLVTLRSIAGTVQCAQVACSCEHLLCAPTLTHSHSQTSIRL